MSDSELMNIDNSIMDPKHLQAINNLRSKEVPKDAIKTHPGKGGQTFSYVDHVWVTEQLQDALHNMWDWDVLSWEVFEDSVVVCGRLTLHIPFRYGLGGEESKIYDRSVTEIGSFDRRKGMSVANTVASAASRALCRAAMRMFGIGIEFYKKNKEDDPTTDEAWGAIRKFVENQGQKYDEAFKKDFGARLKDAGINNDNILDRFQEAYKIVADMLGKGKPKEEMPEA